MTTPLRLGLLLDGPEVHAWVYDLLESLLQSPHCKVVLQLFLPHTLQRPPTLFAQYQRLDRRLFRLTPDPLAWRNSGPLLSAIPTGPLTPPYTPLAAQDLDLLLHLGANPFPPLLYPLARYGIWSYDAALKNGTVGWHQLMHGAPTTPSHLYMQTAADAPAILLYDSHAGTHRYSLHRNQHRVYWKTSQFLERKLVELSTQGKAAFLTRHRSSPKPNAVASYPANRTVLKDLCWFVLRRSGQGLRDRFTRTEWSLLLAQQQGLPQDFRQFTKLSAPPDRFWADPFIVRQAEQYFLFVEELPYATGKGHLAVIALDEALNPGPSRPILEKPYHLSYPFIFSWQGERYMIPETGANRSIDVYRCLAFPDQWAFHQCLMDQVRASDTTLLQHNDRWWLFTALAHHPAASTRDELFLFYSDQPFGAQWHPHPLNPIVSDARKARPAGRIFSHAGRLYRPAQNCSVRYGYGLKIQEITRLNEVEYQEREVRSYQPDKENNLDGMHTFNQADGLTVIDAKIRRWSF